MNCRNIRVWLVSAALGGLGGCTSPPSVVPLLAVSQQAVTAEADRLREDVERDRTAIDRTRSDLVEAFDGDLRDQARLDPDWVMEATRVYVAAREALLEHELALREERHRRADNLDAAAEATGRAMELIERRDALLSDTTIARLWRVLADEPEGGRR